MRKSMFGLTLLLVGLGMLLTSQARAAVQNDSLEADFGFRVALQYAHSDLAAADGGTPNIPVAGTRDTSAATQANTEYTMPFSGRIIGLSATSNAALTAGSLHLRATVNGTEVGTSVGVTLSGNSGSTTTTTNYTNLVDRFTKSSPYTFAAGDRIGVSMKTTPGNAPTPTTADIVVTVIVDQNAQE